MSSTAISANLPAQPSPGYFQQRRAYLQQLSQDLQSGNLSAAQQDFSSIQTLAQSGPFGGDAFKVSARQQDFAAIGQALQSGDVAGRGRRSRNCRAPSSRTGHDWIRRQPPQAPRRRPVLRLSSISGT